ncbi:polar amino acid transport system substrate-binding protein [Pseudomonas indica]|uniref:Polar amino acid transport system substrate-binding protein n=2 Tax=Pseudomonas indica TaxID=137658 RepID=A0A1G9JZJ0_9PSED|nr:polar amino acid transport system substrate-binding protein [Pseudomonas indica]
MGKRALECHYFDGLTDRAGDVRVVRTMAAWWLRLVMALLLCTDARAAELLLYTEENPPINFSHDGVPDGMAVAVVTELLRRTETRAEIKVVPWARGYKMATTLPNVGLFVTVRTPDRETLFRWVGPIVSTSTSLYARKGEPLPVSSLEEARQLSRIAVPREWYSHQVLVRLGFTNLELVPKPHEMVRMTLLGRVPLMVYEDQLLPGLLKEVGAPPDALQPVHTFMRTSSYIAFSLETEKALVQRWQAALDDMKHDGSFARIHYQWFPDSSPAGLKADQDMLP